MTTHAQQVYKALYSKGFRPDLKEIEYWISQCDEESLGDEKYRILQIESSGIFDYLEDTEKALDKDEVKMRVIHLQFLHIKNYAQEINLDLTEAELIQVALAVSNNGVYFQPLEGFMLYGLTKVVDPAKIAKHFNQTTQTVENTIERVEKLFNYLNLESDDRKKKRG